jgi:nucleoside 2-deoxyribosyltransferase
MNEKLELRIYLSGTVSADEYRNFVESEYSRNLILYNPLKNITKDIISKEIGNNTGYIFVVKKDKKDILKSDILVAYIKDGISTFGTSMEIIFAHGNSIPVFVIDETKKSFDDYWVKFHTTKFFESIEECFEFILGERE